MNHLDMVFQRYPVLEACRKDVRQAAAMMIACYEGKGKILLCGNGGSQADADHMVGELMKGFLLQPSDSGDISEDLSREFWRWGLDGGPFAGRPAGHFSRRADGAEYGH
ncbi:MAG: SIS domain-containing protein [Clostridia bacterium]